MGFDGRVVARIPVTVIERSLGIGIVVPAHPCLGGGDTFIEG